MNSSRGTGCHSVSHVCFAKVMARLAHGHLEVSGRCSIQGLIRSEIRLVQVVMGVSRSAAIFPLVYQLYFWVFSPL